MNNHALDFKNTPPGTKVKVLLDKEGNVYGTPLQYERKKVATLLDVHKVYTTKKLFCYNHFRATIYLEEDADCSAFDAGCFTYADNPVPDTPVVPNGTQLELDFKGDEFTGKQTLW